MNTATLTREVGEVERAGSEETDETTYVGRHSRAGNARRRVGSRGGRHRAPSTGE
jgi:hypothetical protein